MEAAETLQLESIWIDGDELPLIGGLLILNATYVEDPRQPKGWALDATVDGRHIYSDGQDVKLRLLVSDGRDLEAAGWVYRCEDASAVTTLLISGGGHVSGLA